MLIQATRSCAGFIRLNHHRNGYNRPIFIVYIILDFSAGVFFSTRKAVSDSGASVTGQTGNCISYYTAINVLYIPQGLSGH